MIIGTVVNTLETKQCNPQLDGRKLLLVKSWDNLVPAVDQVGASAGDRVLLVTGEAALRCCMEAPTDAAVIAILDTKAIE